MTNYISAAFIVMFLSAIGSKILAAPMETDGNDDGVVSILVNPEEYENLGDDFWPSVALKRASFWSPHPSDYNPMRRPGPMPRNSKRDMPYHPHPRLTTMKQRSVSDENMDGYGLLDASRVKKQTRAATLLFRLNGGAQGYPNIRRPGQKYVPSEPANNSS